MKAHVFLNEGDDHFSGWRPTHAGDLKLGATLTFPEYDDAYAALELVFEVCNGADPESEMLWYTHGHRSFSVGDVVVLERDGVQVPWTCDALGWTALSAGTVRVHPTEVPAPK